MINVRFRRARDCARVVIVLAGLALAVAARASDSPSELWPGRTWQRATPGDVGLDAQTLTTLDRELASGKYGIVDSLEVFRCGREVFTRRYPHDYARIYAKEAATRGPLNARLTGRYNYFDPAWHPYYHGTDMHTMQSVSKTVTSAIIGIAMLRGDFKASIDTPVLSYFDPAKVKNVDDRKHRMTLRHVLTMSHGLNWVEDVPYDDPRSDSSLMEATDDWVQYVIDKPMAEEPGTRFNYSSGATELLAYIFKRETGRDIEAYGEEYLFKPLGIRHHWKRTYNGLVDTEGGLYLSGADLAKIGYLYLHDGAWAGRQILPADWVRQSLTPYFDTGWQGLKYGFKWWLHPRTDGHQAAWMGIGFGGQRLMVFPEEELIATITAWDILKDPPVEAELADRVVAAVRTAKCPGPAR